MLHIIVDCQTVYGCVALCLVCAVQLFYGVIRCHLMFLCDVTQCVVDTLYIPKCLI